MLMLALTVLLTGCRAGTPLRSVALQPPPQPTKADLEEPRAGKEIDYDKLAEEKRKNRVKPRISVDTMFTLIYYVGVNRNDRRRAVVLDREDDDIEFIPTVRDFEYEILQNVTIPEAVYEAEIFFGNESVIYDYYFREVRGTDGQPIGYELRPVYYEDFFGYIDPLDISYQVNRKRVSVDIDYIRGLYTR